ncbi:MAG TPA: peptide deformylase [Gammaproteobacteria bacterium]|nr:peptide deformylase [Gammaproteobacteria bacterium]
MSVRDVLKMGDPRLYQVSSPVADPKDFSIENIVQDMYDTMYFLDGIGLAAPQIGIFERIVIFGVKENSRYPDAETVPDTVLINPTVEVINPERVGAWEGCLSIPGMRGFVERPTCIRYTGFDMAGNSIDREVSGFHARVVQHECDHLDGILYPLRIKDMKTFGFEDVISGQVEY